MRVLGSYFAAFNYLLTVMGLLWAIKLTVLREQSSLDLNPSGYASDCCSSSSKDPQLYRSLYAILPLVGRQ